MGRPEQPNALIATGTAIGSLSPLLDQFRHIPRRLLESQDTFWIITRDGEPAVAVEQSTATAWTPSLDDNLDLMDLYGQQDRSVLAVAVAMLRWARCV
jgi:hypothetical protein